MLAYALPARTLRPLLPLGLELDTYEDRGFLAIALVQTENLRPKGFPRAFGRDFFLSGYRVFARFARPGRQTLRGLRILRSDTDRRVMVALGNLFTHYGYALSTIDMRRDGDHMEINVTTPSRQADLHVVADLSGVTAPPEGSPFRTLADARRFAGPLPYTFDFDEPTGKMLVVRGLRSAWEPRPVHVETQASSFLERFDSPRLANAFFVENVPYAWRPGVLEDLS